MSVLEDVRPSRADLFGISNPLDELDDEVPEGVNFIAHSDGLVVDDFLPSRKANPLGRALAVLAMLASVGAGASLTFAVLDYRAPRPADAAQPSPESTGSIVAQKSTAIPHSIWGPLVNTIPSANLLSPSESDAAK